MRPYSKRIEWSKHDEWPLPAGHLSGQACHV